MGYRKNKWYIVGLILVIASLADMGVTFLLMGLGFDNAIFPFFVACPFLVAGIWMIQIVKRNFFEAADDESVSGFRYVWLRLKALYHKNGAVRLIYVSVMWIFTLVAAVLLIRCAYSSYAAKAVTRNPQYIDNDTLYNEYIGRWRDVRAAGDETRAHEYFEKAEEYRLKNSADDARIAAYQQTEKELMPAGIIAAAVAAVLLCCYAVFRKYMKIQNRDRKNLNNPEQNDIII